MLSVGRSLSLVRNVKSHLLSTSTCGNLQCGEVPCWSTIINGQKRNGNDRPAFRVTKSGGFLSLGFSIPAQTGQIRCKTLLLYHNISDHNEMQLWWFEESCEKRHTFWNYRSGWGLSLFLPIPLLFFINGAIKFIWHKAEASSRLHSQLSAPDSNWVICWTWQHCGEDGTAAPVPPGYFSFCAMCTAEKICIQKWYQRALKAGKEAWKSWREKDLALEGDMIWKEETGFIGGARSCSRMKSLWFQHPHSKAQPHSSRSSMSYYWPTVSFFFSIYFQQSTCTTVWPWGQLWTYQIAEINNK